MPGHNGAASKAIQRSASTFKDLTGRAGQYMEEDIRVASMGEISAYAKECVDATLHPGVLAAGAQKQSRRSGATRVAYRNRLRQAEVGRAILEDRAMRAAAPLSPALVESQATMLRNIHEAQARGGAAASKLRSRVAVVVAANRLASGAARAKQLRDGALLRRLRVGALAVLAAQCLLAGLRKQGGSSRGSDNDLRAAVDQCRSMLAAHMPNLLKPGGASATTKAATLASGTGTTTPAASSSLLSRSDSRASAGGAAASAAVGAKAKADFIKIGSAVADMLRETNLPTTLGQSDASHNSSSSSGGGNAEVWLFEHSQRSVDVQSLSASALHPDLYAFAAHLPRDKARERRERCVAYLKRAVEEALRGVGHEASAMVAKGIFHPDANRQRALAASRVALLEALDLPKADEKVLREMKGEHEIKEAEDKVEGARVLAVAAKAEREDWEGRQREALSEMRLDQLKDRATAIDIEIPSASHRLKLDLIEGILDVRRRLRFPRAPSGRFEADDAEEAARAACEEVKAAVEAARAEAQAVAPKNKTSKTSSSRLSKTTAAAIEAEEAAAALAQERRRVREERRAQMAASLEGAHQEAMSALAAHSNGGSNGSGAKRQEDLRKHRRRALEAKNGASSSSSSAAGFNNSSSYGSGAMDEEMRELPVASGMLSLSGMQPVVVPRSVLLQLTEERVRRQQNQLAHAAEVQRLEQEQHRAQEAQAAKAAEARAKKRAEERALLGVDGQEMDYVDNNIEEGEDPRDLFTVRSSEQSTTVAGHKHPELADAASLSSAESSAAPHDRRGSRAAGVIQSNNTSSIPLEITWDNGEKDLPPAWARNGRASPNGPLVENTDGAAAFWRARVSEEPSTATASKKKQGGGTGSNTRGSRRNNNNNHDANANSANRGGERRTSGGDNLADLADVSSFQATYNRLLRRSNLGQQQSPPGSSSPNGHSSPSGHGNSEQLPAVNMAGGPALVGATLSSSLRRGGSPLAATLHPKGALALQPPSLSRREMMAQEEENRKQLVAWQRAHKGGDGEGAASREENGNEKVEHGENDSVVSGSNNSAGGGNEWAADEPLPLGSKARLYTPGAPSPPPSKPTAHTSAAGSTTEVSHAAAKLHRPLRHTKDTRKRTAALFEALEMPTEKQLAFLTRYSASFGDTARLDEALGAWENAAALVRLREYTLARLALLEKGHWLEPFELFDQDQERSLRQVSAWVMRPTPMLFGVPPNAAEKAQAAAAEEQANADALSVPFNPNISRPGSRSGSRLGSRGRASMDVPGGAGFTRDDDGNVTPTSPAPVASPTTSSASAAPAAAEGPSVGFTLTQPTPVETDLWDVQKGRELQRLATVNWLRRILSRITRHATKALQVCEDRFGDAVSFQGRDYAATINVAGAV